ncbi:MAG: cache domain-containing protein [Limisphaerales bacterium]
MLVLGLGIAVAGIYPLISQLEQEHKVHLEYTANVKILAVNQVISEFKSLAQQIGSRTKAREALVSHNEGRMPLEEFTEFSGPILTDALNRSTAIISITRHDDQGNAVVHVGLKIPSGTDPSPADDEDPVVNGPMRYKGMTLVRVISPIRDRAGKRVGFDVVAFQANALEHITGRDFAWSKTGKTILGRMDGDGITPFFNREESKQKLVNDPALLEELDTAYIAGSGYLEIIDGDGKEIQLTARAIRESGWILLLMVDREETYAAAREQVRPVAMMIPGIVLLATVGMTVLVQVGRRNARMIAWYWSSWSRIRVAAFPATNWTRSSRSSARPMRPPRAPMAARDWGLPFPRAS